MVFIAGRHQRSYPASVANVSIDIQNIPITIAPAIDCSVTCPITELGANAQKIKEEDMPSAWLDERVAEMISLVQAGVETAEVLSFYCSYAVGVAAVGYAKISLQVKDGETDTVSVRLQRVHGSASVKPLMKVTQEHKRRKRSGLGHRRWTTVEHQARDLTSAEQQAIFERILTSLKQQLS